MPVRGRARTGLRPAQATTSRGSGTGSAGTGASGRPTLYSVNMLTITAAPPAPAETVPEVLR